MLQALTGSEHLTKNIKQIMDFICLWVWDKAAWLVCGSNNGLVPLAIVIHTIYHTSVHSSAIVCEIFEQLLYLRQRILDILFLNLKCYVPGTFPNVLSHSIVSFFQWMGQMSMVCTDKKRRHDIIIPVKTLATSVTWMSQSIQNHP